MPAVKLLEPSQVDPGVKETMTAAENHFGHVPNLVKALANNPDMCRSITEFLIQSLGEGRLSWQLKELIILKTLRACGSHYGYGAHEKLAARLGVAEEKISDVSNALWKTSPHFSEGEKLLMELVEQIAEDANNVSDDLWEKLRSNWDNGQLLEANAVITTFIMLGRLGDTLGVSDPELFSKAL